MARRFDRKRTPSASTAWMLLAGMLLQCACAYSAQPNSQDVARVVAVSDIHGAFDALQRTLRNSGIIDEQDRWAGVDARLVVTGDILDRGPASRAVMDLLMRLEIEAAAAGGAVHVLLGNHEVMNLVGDLRYVAVEEYAAFAPEETAAERDYWGQQFIERATAFESATVLAEQFERAHPPGFFAHRRAFAADGLYGKWLLAKPAIIILNRTAYVHGGLSPRIAEFGLESTNRLLRERLTEYMRAVATLNDAGILHPGDNFYAHSKILAELDAASELDEAVRNAIAVVLHDPELRVDDLDGPLWYRGNVICPPLAESSRLAAALDALGADRVVIGHTPTASREVVSRLGGRVIEIDTGMLQSYYRGSGHALELSGDELAVIDEQGRRVAITEDPRPNGQDDMSNAAIETLLASGTVSLGERRDDGWVAAQVTLDDQTVNALFLPLRSKRSAPAVAAYRLDRLIELYMVPATMIREIDGKRGVLQLLPPLTVDEAQRRKSQASTGAWCPLPLQWDVMYVFDTLIQNEIRAQQHMLYSRESWQLFLMNHEDAFGTSRRPPRYLQDATLNVSDAWRDALLQLEENVLQEALEDVLDRRQLRALRQRRDKLLEQP